MFGNVLTYDAYHLALYLLTALAWGVLGLWFLMSGGRRGVAQVLRHVWRGAADQWIHADAGYLAGA
jgi:hypothetical protein